MYEEGSVRLKLIMLREGNNGEKSKVSQMEKKRPKLRNAILTKRLVRKCPMPWMPSGLACFTVTWADTS